MDETTKAAMESGRPLTIFNIKEVHQLNPNATHITNNYYGDKFMPKDNFRHENSDPENATRNPQLIIDYVMRLHPSHVRQEWQEKYQTLWKSILELPAVACKVYDKGRQQGTTFNRNLVANILHLLAERRVLTINANPTEMAKLLEGDANASVRAKLGEMPEAEIKKMIEGKIKESSLP